MKWHEPYPFVHVYKDLLPETSLLKDIADEVSEADTTYVYVDWRDWYAYGRICGRDQGAIDGIRSFDATYQKATEDGNADLFLKELFLFRKISTVKDLAFDHYISHNKIAVPEPYVKQEHSLAFYWPDFDMNGEGHAMQYHTDYNIGEWWWPGLKFLLTMTIYINDDYDGGEVVFWSDGKLTSYKPQAGDVVVFPSGDPLFPGGDAYFHCVKGIRGAKKKYLIRSYVQYHSPHNAYFWYLNKKRYGNENWKKMTHDAAKHKNILSWKVVEPDPENARVHFNEIMRNLFQ